MKTNLAAVLKDFANPPLLSIEAMPVPEPGPGELLLEMKLAPINPADINILEGKYGELPKLPTVVGNEGVGRVAGIGSGVKGFSEGDLVLPMKRGTWCQWMTVSAASAIPLPAHTGEAQAAMLSVNPATALLLLESMVCLSPGDLVIQNASNSGVGRSVIQIAALLGLRTINVVRRPELFAELQEAGADLVLLEEDDLRPALAGHFDGFRPLLGLNAVGGSSALQLANTLADGGTLVTYGAMGRQPLKVPNGLLIFRDLCFRGFWLTRWLKKAGMAEQRALYQRLADWMTAEKLTQPVAEVFSLSEIPKALEQAASDRRSGKILLDLSAS